MPPNPKWKHRLVSKDRDTLQGTCALCGPVDLVVVTNGQRKPILQCAVARSLHRATANRYRPGHGLSTEDAALMRQERSCAICGGPGQAVDHDHKSGRIRDVLCRRCNVALGMLNDDPERVDAAAGVVVQQAYPDGVTADERMES
jgi:hypothetical protein